MHSFSPALVQRSLRFGRAPARLAAQRRAVGEGLASDIKLFAFTFLGGFLFVSVLIG